MVSESAFPPTATKNIEKKYNAEKTSFRFEYRKGYDYCIFD